MLNDNTFTMRRKLFLSDIDKNKMEEFCKKFDWGYPIEKDVDLTYLYNTVTEEDYLYFKK